MVPQGLTCGKAAFFGQCLQVSAKPRRGRSAIEPTITAALKVRPYTVRKGDTLETIAEKRDVTVKEIIALNHGMNPSKVEEKQTILIPGNRLSARDKEILAGIGPRTYRTYPVRAGENIKDIISKRNITRAEADALNPEVNLDKLTPAQVIKLPAGKYTVREREMLTSVAGAPEAYFMLGHPFANGILGIVAVGIGLSWYLFRQKDEPDEDEELA